MSHFREVLQCRGCGKIYRSAFFPGLHSPHEFDDVCGKCGAHNGLKWVIAKPKLFGLVGWEVKKNSKQDKFKNVDVIWDRGNDHLDIRSTDGTPLALLRVTGNEDY